MEAPYRSWVEISRRRIAENYRAVRAAVGPGVEAVCGVKADAYGHGAVEVSRTLMAEGARWLAVSSADEGAALRQAGIAARILVMADCQPFERPALLEYDLTPVVLSLDGLRGIESFAAARAEILHCSGTQFDPSVVSAFLGLLAGQDRRYQNGRKIDFDLEFSSDRFLAELPEASVAD